MKDLKAKLVCVFAGLYVMKLKFGDPNLAAIKGSPVDVVLQSLQDNHIKYELFTDIEVEPTDSSFKRASAFASSLPFDAFVAVGGGSTMDTAKAANLYSTYPPENFLGLT